MLYWCSRKHTHVVRSTYAAELHSSLGAVNQGSLFSLCMRELLLGIRTARELLQEDARGHVARAMNMIACVDAHSVFASVTADTVRTPNDKHLLVHALALREFLDDGTLKWLMWCDTRDTVPDALTKGAIDREALIAASCGTWTIVGDTPKAWTASVR